MYRHLLVPIDASESSERAMEGSIQLAAQLGASITGFVAAPPAPRQPPGRTLPMLRQEAHDHDAITEAHARAILERFEARARERGVPFVGRHASAPRIEHAILAEAEAQGCDMIVMVTEGRGAFGEFLFGSDSKAVLSGSKLPLLVLH